MVVGNEIIEAPMGWHSRFFMYTAFRSLTTEYFKKGATIVAAPKPRMDNDFFDQVDLVCVCVCVYVYVCVCA